MGACEACVHHLARVPQRHYNQTRKTQFVPKLSEKPKKNLSHLQVRHPKGGPTCLRGGGHVKSHPMMKTLRKIWWREAPKGLLGVQTGLGNEVGVMHLWSTHTPSSPFLVLKHLPLLKLLNTCARKIQGKIFNVPQMWWSLYGGISSVQKKEFLFVSAK